MAATYDQVEYSYPPPGDSRRRAFDAIFDRGRTRIIRLLGIGDSQETTGGQGNNYLNAMNATLARVYGKSPATPFCTFVSSSANWLVNTQAPGGHTAYTQTGRGFTSDKLLSGMNLTGLVALSPTNTYVGGGDGGPADYGAHISVRPGNIHATDTSQYIGDTTLRFGSQFDATSGVYVEVLSATYSSSGEIKVRYGPTATQTKSLDDVSYGSTGVADYDVSAVGLQSATTGSFVTWTSKLFPYRSSYPFVQVSVASSVNGKEVSYFGARVLSAAKTTGGVYDQFGQSGGKCSDFVTNCANSGAAVAAMQPDLVILHFGTNDSASRTIVQYEADVRAAIAILRSSMPGLPIVLASDLYAASATLSVLEQMPGVHKTIASDTANILAVNSYRAAYERGWNINNTNTNASTPAGLADFHVDSVHHTPLGARLAAEIDLGLMMGPLSGPAVTLPSGVAALRA